MVLTPDRELTTVLFTDIVGSTERASLIGDARWNDLLSRHHEIVRRHLVRFHGCEVVTLGDGFLATFDGPARAVQCAIGLTHAIRSLELEIRAGIHTGEIERRGGDVAGIAVHIGARVAALAGPNETLATRTVKDLTAGSGLHFADRGEHILKGVSDAWHLYAVTAEHPDAAATIA